MACEDSKARIAIRLNSWQRHVNNPHSTLSGSGFIVQLEEDNMSKKQIIAIIVSASVTALIVSVILKTVGLPAGDAHPIITGAIASAVAAVVGQKVKAAEDSESTPD